MKSILIDYISKKSLEFENKTAIEMTDGESITYQTLIKNVRCYTSALKSLGLSPGDRIILSLSNRLEYVYLILACANSGVVYCPLLSNFDDTTRIKAIEAILPKYIITDKHQDFKFPEAQVIHIDGLPINISSELVTPPDLKDYDLFRMLWSSGSTSLPKIIQWRQSNLLYERLRWQQALDITADDIFFCRHTLDVAHATDLHLFSSLLAGATLILCKCDESQEEINEHIFHYKPTIMSALPYHYEQLADSAQQKDFGFIKKPLCGGTYLSPSLVKKVFQKTGLSLMPLYGSTDFGLAMLSANSENLTLELKLVPGVYAEIIPINSKNAHIGELCLYSPYMSDGYLNNSEANTRTFQGDKYVTGDIAQKLDNGNYVILGRTHDIILTNNSFIMSTELENSLKDNIPGYDFTCLPKDKNHIYIAATPMYSMPTSELSPMLNTFFIDKPLTWKLIVFDKFPRTSVGKIDKPQIFDYFEHEGNNIY